jgi:hypothetical protein
MLYDINIETWNKIVTFLQRDVNNIYICFYFDIYSCFYMLHHCANLWGKFIVCYVQKQIFNAYSGLEQFQQYIRFRKCLMISNLKFGMASSYINDDHFKNHCIIFNFVIRRSYVL